MSSLINQKIKQFNLGRLPNTLGLKYKVMRKDPFKFLRSTTHLFYEDIPKHSLLFKSPAAWLCGDFHLENIGSYKGDNRVAYFNVNDFDECCLAPVLLDVYRMLTSIYVSSEGLDLRLEDTHELCNIFIASYFSALEEGYIRVLEKETTKGVIKSFLKKVSQRKRNEFLKKWVVKKKNKRKIKIDEIHTLPTGSNLKETIQKHIKSWAKHTTNPDFYKVHDIVFRIAGASSLGLERYAVLVEGRGSPGENFMLDLKETTPSCLEKFNTIIQPPWENNAQRQIEVQKRTLSYPPALLADILIGKKHFVLKELQPAADRIDYSIFHGKLKKFKDLIENVASISAWNNLRSTGRQGSAIADELIYFAKTDKGIRKILRETAYSYSKVLAGYYKSFCQEYDKGYFDIASKRI